MNLQLTPIRTALLASIALNLLISASSAEAHGLQPSMTSTPASGIMPTAATLDGNVSANGAPATAWFQWGTSTNYGNLTAATNLPFTNIYLPVSMAISNLTPNVTYHFCVAASNSYGLATGSDMTFLTPSIFTNLNAVLPGLSLSSVAWGDYDNDGLLDILVTGMLESGSPISQVYHNNGNGSFTLNTNAVLPGVYYGSVAWGDYDNDGRLDILLTGQPGSGGGISQVYHNDGGGNFSLNTNAVLPGVVDGSVAWGDYDNDGRLDILITGGTDSGSGISQVYHNNGDGSFSLNTNAVLPGVYDGSVAWGDYDNDGRLDILLTGDTGTTDTNWNGIYLSSVYHNNGDGSFTLNTNVVLPGVFNGSVAWGDYDNDGRLDFLLTGAIGLDEHEQPIPISRLYHNNGNGTFSWNTNAVLPGLCSGSAAWGDYDNDGRLDILLAGETGVDTNRDPIGICSVYHNNGDGTFSLNTNTALPGVYYGSAAWGDYDNDGRLDVLLTGQTGYDPDWNPIEISGVYRNLTSITNTPPAAPTGLTATVSNQWVTLAWAAASDAQSPAPGLTYNLRIGSTPGGSDLLSPQANTNTGFRRLAQMGNTQLGTNAIVNLTSPPGGMTCYWSAQAVDSAWAASPFAVESSFYLPTQPTPVTLPAAAITGTQATLQGSVNPGGLATLAWFKWGTNTSYGNLTTAANLSATNTALAVSAAVSNLTPGWTYHFCLAASNSDGATVGGDQNFTTPFPPAVTTLAASNISITGATLNGTVNPNGLSATAWFQWGTNTNYGNLTFATNLSATNASLPVSIAISNLTPGQTYHFQLGSSNGAGVSLSSDTNFATLPPVPPNVATAPPGISALAVTFNGMVNPNGMPATVWFQWGTDTNYGNVTAATNLPGTNATLGVSIAVSIPKPDLTYHFRLAASNSAGLVTGGDLMFMVPEFNNLNAGLPGVSYGSVAWGDYDNDGRLDILLTGMAGLLDTNGIPIFISRVYHNNGDGSFTLNTNAVLPGVAIGSVAWGDYDNDGYLDILLTGASGVATNSMPIVTSQVYHNNRDGTFTLDTNAVLPGVWGSSAAWGDYDNDGQLDILLAGQTVSGNAISQVYHNNGDGSFTLNTQAILPGVYYGSVAWGDYDNDGRLDILLTGMTVAGQGAVTQVYHNNGDGSFSLNTNAVLPVMAYGSVAWGDYDNDGRLDILLTGTTSNYITQIYHNNGDGSFSLNTNAVLPGVIFGSVAWGDYDNDGWLDILLTGQTETLGDRISCVYHNNRDGTFSLDTNMVLPAVSCSAAAWGDCDGDGRLDILLEGQTTNGDSMFITSIYRNINPVTNIAPNAPTGLTATMSNDLLTLAWAAAAGGQTPAPGLSYNLRAGTTPGGSDIVAPESNPASGWRRLPQMGNTQLRTNAILDLSGRSGITGGATCYWSVQAVDPAWAGSPFAMEGSFPVPPKPPIAITLPAANIAATQAALQGSVTPSGLPTMAWFEWGLTADYGSFTAELFPGGGSEAVTLSNALTGLTPCTSYHYRVDAVNDLGATLGEDQSFTTPDVSCAITNCCLTATGQFQFQFTGAAASTYTVLCSTNLALPLSNWTLAGAVTNISPGQYQFTDPAGETNRPQRFYLLRQP